GLRIMQSGRGPWANPGSLIRAMGEMLAHIGYGDRKAILDKAMDICTVTEKKLVITGRQDGCTGAEFTDYLIDTIRQLRAE
ncbi:MAG: isocitrate/isopropylmalate dehydrogenase family protein, partial [Oscillospiraceae bacterium]|nr:isocitrate/isopropylmalate dehydrogenase family protein [Oscillospiraceae bacterium]